MPVTANRPHRAGRPLHLATVLMLLLALGARAGLAAGRVGVVAPLGGLGLPASEASRVQRWLEAALAGVAGYRWLAPGRLVKLLRAPRLLGCDSQPACLGGLARQLGADLVVAGDVGSLGGGYMVYLRLVNAQGKSVRAVSAVLDPSQSGLRDAARALAIQLLEPGRFTGGLAVQVDVPNAWIYLDGKRVARSPAAPVGGLGVGPHAVRVTHEAYRDFVRFVNVEFGRTAQVTVSLTAYPIRAEQMRLVVEKDRTFAGHELPWYRRWWALTALGAVVLAGSATTAALLFQRATPHDAELRVRP